MVLEGPQLSAGGEHCRRCKVSLQPSDTSLFTLPKALLMRLPERCLIFVVRCTVDDFLLLSYRGVTSYP